jgi:small-conductance mechanosensitive channel
VSGNAGVVEEIAFRTTMLKTADGREVIVPNGIFMTSAVTNLTRFPLRRGTLWLIVADGEKPIAAEDIRQALGEAEGVAKEPEPTVELRSVTEGRAHDMIGSWAADRDMVASAAMTALRARFPQGEVHGG